MSIFFGFILRMTLLWLKIFYYIIKEFYKFCKRKLSRNKVMNESAIHKNENLKKNNTIGLVDKMLEIENFL